MKLLIDYNIEIVKLLKADEYTKEEVLIILEQALRNVVPDEINVINEKDKSIKTKDYSDFEKANRFDLIDKFRNDLEIQRKIREINKSNKNFYTEFQFK